MRLAGKNVFVSGHRGMVGSALVRRLQRESCKILTASRADLDLRDQRAVATFMDGTRPDVVVIAAATVGGIVANDTYPADFLYDNLMIEANLINAAHATRVGKLLFLGSSCIYPREAPQPIPESALLTGPLESTNEWYAIAKIAGIKMCQAYRKQHGCDFIAAMPSNLYGPNDSYHPTRSHVIPALMARFHAARHSGADVVTCWGSGRPRREFLYVDDFVDACVILLENYSGSEHVNIGTGEDITVAELAAAVANVTGYHGRIAWDTSKPDGTMAKRMDVHRIEALGWRATTPFLDGLAATYAWFRENAARGL